MPDLSIPRIHHWIEILKDRNEYGNSWICDKSREIVFRLADALSALRPVGPDDCHVLWFKAKRGNIEDFGDYDEYLSDGDVENYDEFVKLWKDYFPDEERWYQMTYVHHDDFYGVFLDHEVVASFRKGEKSPGWLEDTTEIFNWLYSQTLQAIDLIKNGMYSDIINSGVGPRQRYGTISQRDYWQEFPESLHEYIGNIGEENAKEFVALMKSQESNRNSITPLPHLTAREFFEYCKMGYIAMQKAGYKDYKYDEDLPGIDWYKRFADGRDDGLTEIDQDSPEAFQEWLHNPNGRTGHPWEISRGGNSTHIDFYVRDNVSAYEKILYPDTKQKEGLIFGVAGKSYSRSAEAIHLYLALHHAGLPVLMNDGEEMAKRITGDINIGIVPDGIFPRYCGSAFNEKILDFMNLPYEKDECDKVVAHAHWLPLEDAELKEDTME